MWGAVPRQRPAVRVVAAGLVALAWAPTSSAQTCSVAFISSALYGDIEQLRLCIDEEEVGCVDDRGQTPLHHAASANQIMAAVRLLDAGATMDRDTLGRTPLHNAAISGHETMVLLLLDSGAYIELVDNAGRTPLILAAREGHDYLIPLLLGKGARINAKDKDQMTPMHFSATTDRFLNTTKLLSDRGADVDSQDVIGFSPLHYSSFENAFETCKLLIAQGAGVFLLDKSGWSPLAHAARNDHTKLVEYIVVHVLQPKVYPTPDPSGFLQQDMTKETICCGIQAWMAGVAIIGTIFMGIVVPLFCVMRRAANLNTRYVASDQYIEEFVQEVFEAGMSAKRIKALGKVWDQLPAHTLQDLHRVRNSNG